MKCVPTIYFVPGDDWVYLATIAEASLQQGGYAGWNVLSAVVRWNKRELGSANIGIEASDIANGSMTLSMHRSATAGPLYVFGGEITVRLISPGGIKRTVFFARSRAKKVLKHSGH